MHSELSRIYSEALGKELNKALCGEVYEMLNTTFLKELEDRELKFEILGFTYPQEFMLIASVCSKNADENSLRTNFFASTDLAPNCDENKMLLIFNKAIDALGHCLEDYFSIPEWNEYFDFWQELTVGKKVFYVKSNRENIKHTLLADQILRASSGDTF